MRNRVLLFILLIILSGLARAGELNLKIIYPKPDVFVRAVDSMFIFGSVNPGSEVTVNGFPVAVHDGGGWLAFVAVSPGPFMFNVIAEKDGVRDEQTVSVSLPALPSYDYSKLAIEPNSVFPDRTLAARPGDVLDLTCSGLPYCEVICVVQPMGDTIALQEQPPRYYYGGTSVFAGDAARPRRYPDSMLIRGRYAGTYKIPETDADSIGFTYLIYPPTPRQITMISHEDIFSTTPALLTRLRGHVECEAQRWLSILHENHLPTVELKDSLTIVRSGPGKGYLLVHQPKGIRAKLIGTDGRWLKIKLSEYQYGWIIDTSAVVLPATEPVPHSYISKVQTINYADRVSVVFSTSGMHPFRVQENLADKTITVFLYGADGDTDWIRYDNSDKLIDHAVWYQPEPGIYALEIHLTEDKIWGYDGYYIGSEFHFDIKKFPHTMWDVSQFRFIIDPGHEPDAGAVGPTGLAEKIANLMIAERLKTALEIEGADVVMTREGNSGLGLYDRPKLAVSQKADIFISIHNNALPDGTNPFENNGTATFYYHPHSAPLAMAVHDCMKDALPLKDFGYYYGNLAVIRPTQYPAILVECAFMMIPEHEAKLKTKGFQKKIANAIVRGIKAYIGGPKMDGWDEHLKR
ncbi:MAG: N-acetylmuramoyl-L-alanine amidase [Candidatus Zixiibacteriota bacterium]